MRKLEVRAQYSLAEEGAFDEERNAEASGAEIDREEANSNPMPAIGTKMVGWAGCVKLSCTAMRCEEVTQQDLAEIETAWCACAHLWHMVTGLPVCSQSVHATVTPVVETRSNVAIRSASSFCIMLWIPRSGLNSFQSSQRLMTKLRVSTIELLERSRSIYAPEARFERSSAISPGWIETFRTIAPS